MSGGSYSTYKDGTDLSTRYTSTDDTVREHAEAERATRIRHSRETAAREAPRERAKEVSREPEIHADLSLASNCIQAPPAEAKEIHLFLVDNSGSNKEIAQAIRRASGYIHANAGILAGDSAIAFQFFSDHCDGTSIFQEADYTMPGERGESILRASVARIHDAGGGDAPEAIECALKRVAEYPFGNISKERRHIYLVTDVVAHGMGMPDDHGCPNQVSWRKSLASIHETFHSFQVIASGNDREAFELQKQFLEPNRVRFDLMDLSTGRLTHEERCRLVPNAILLFLARNRGKQATLLFLSTLFQKWLENPQYGSDTERRARLQISDFAQYLENSKEERVDLLKRVFQDE
jgi:hypothetical protein